jgi:hypothetical protein
MGDSNIFSGGLFMTLWLVAFFGYSFYELRRGYPELAPRNPGRPPARTSTGAVSVHEDDERIPHMMDSASRPTQAPRDMGYVWSTDRSSRMN